MFGTVKHKGLGVSPTLGVMEGMTDRLARLLRHMHGQGLSQEKLGKILGVSQAHAGRLLNANDPAKFGPGITIFEAAIRAWVRPSYFFVDGLPDPAEYLRSRPQGLAPKDPPYRAWKEYLDSDPDLEGWQMDTLRSVEFVDCMPTKRAYETMALAFGHVRNPDDSDIREVPAPQRSKG